MIKEIEKRIQAFLGERNEELRFLWFNLSDAALEYHSALIFTGDEPEPQFVLRVASGSTALKSMHMELKNLRFLSHVVREERKNTIPRLLHFEKKGGLGIMLLKAVAGKPLKNEERGPYGSMVRLRMEQISQWLKDFYCETGIEGRIFDKELFQAYVENPVRKFRKFFELTEREKELIERVTGFFQSSVGEPLPFVFKHGDLATSNILVDGSKLKGILDWELPLRRWFPLFDQFYLCASLRYCYYSNHGDRTQFESFQRTYFESNEFSIKVELFLKDTCEWFSIPGSLPFHLFVLSVMTVALWKKGAFLSRRPKESGLQESAGDGEELEIDDPFCAVQGGRCLTFRYAAEHADDFILKGLK
jgi:hypothetical protein